MKKTQYLIFTHIITIFDTLFLLADTYFHLTERNINILHNSDLVNSFSFCVSTEIFISFLSSRDTFAGYRSLCWEFFSQYSTMVYITICCSSLSLACLFFPDKKSTVILFFLPPHAMCLLSPAEFDFLFSLVLSNLYLLHVSRGWSSLSSLDLWIFSFHSIWKNSGHYFFRCFFYLPFSFLSSGGLQLSVSWAVQGFSSSPMMLCSYTQSSYFL